MSLPANFSIPRRPTDRYLVALNDPEGFARRAGITDADTRRYLRLLGAVVRLEVRQRTEVRRKARQLAEELQRLPGIDEWAEGEVTESLREERRRVVGLARGLARAALALELDRIRDEIFGGTVSERAWAEIRRRALRTLEPLLGPSERLTPLGRRLRLCRLCEQLFLPPPRARAQQFCQVCRRRWTKQQLWYRTRKKERGGDHRG